MTRTSPRTGTFVAILAIVVATLLSLGASLARADEPAPAGPAPVPRAENPPVPKKLSADELDRRLESHPRARLAMETLKYAPAFAGLLVIAWALVRRHNRRRGFLPPERPDAVPPAAFGLGLAIGFAAFAIIGGGLIVVPIYIAKNGLASLQDPPLEMLFGATVAGMLPVAIAAAIGIRRGWARRRAFDPSTVFGDGPNPSAESFPPKSPWPALLRWREGLLWFLVASTVVFAVSLVTMFVMNALGVPSEPQDLVLRVVEPRHPYEPWLIAAFGVLVAPITEEYVFRGLLYPAIRDKWTRMGAALVTSALFALVHGSWTAGPALFCLAMLLCWLYERTGSVWPGILVHVLNNATSLLPLLLL